jgi:hypothetical protein
VNLESVVWTLCITILIVLFAGDPDIADSVMNVLSGCDQGVK